VLAHRRTRSIDGVWLGRRRYAEVLRLQERLHAARRAGEIADTVLLLEHEPVITFGRGGKAENLVASAEALAAAGVDVVHTGRGGDVTLHLPGQLVCYPILDLNPDRRDVRRYVKDLAEVMRRVVLEYGLSAGTIERYVGLWVDAESPAYWSGEELAQDPLKLGAIGVSISRWVTLHGFALNLCPELSAFGYIVPCGIREHGVSSVRELTRAEPRVRDAAERALFHLAEVFDAQTHGLQDEIPASWAWFPAGDAREGFQT
jgi:lipoyl(octanoyl) transferase